MSNQEETGKHHLLPRKKKSQSTETESEMLELMELANNDFKTPIVIWGGREGKYTLKETSRRVKNVISK